ncbi:hypothetical protein F511_35634 [Dorcoceras hygrometricum]|uniref:Uncharacterized protein n=1 Tax=Dorcoceras hygrometricum TaxID=472368 RepID=A0A2Z7A6N1_9LAMI|nr:hypothetical protein F511_35634 [Dorcoceras hygrometricum]
MLIKSNQTIQHHLSGQQTHTSKGGHGDNITQWGRTQPTLIHKQLGNEGVVRHSRCRYSDLQDVCMVMESLTTLDLPMVVDSIGIYEFKRPHYTLTMTDWFLQALSVIPRGSWGDVARRFTMIRWGPWGIHLRRTKKFLSLFFLSSPLLSFPRRRRGRKSCTDRSGEEIPSVKSSLSFLVQIGKGIEIPVVDRIRRTKPPTVEVLISS